MSYPHWDYFLTLEVDLINLARYIEFSEKNFDTFSIELVRILLAASSEVDVVAKVLCQQIDPDFLSRIKSGKRNPSINDYKETILSKRPGVVNFRVELPRYGLTLLPWISWDKDGENPDWWKAYNSVKHERNNNFHQANLRNALNSVAGLFGLVLNLYSHENSNRELYPEPRLFKSRLFKSQVMTYLGVQEEARTRPGSGVGLTFD
mgnify:CR=1 FL=1